MKNSRFSLAWLAITLTLSLVKADNTNASQTCDGSEKSCIANLPDRQNSLLQVAGHVSATKVDEETNDPENVADCTFWSGGNLLDKLAIEKGWRTLNGCVECPNDCCGTISKEVEKNLKTQEILDDVWYMPSKGVSGYWVEMSRRFARTCSNTIYYMFGLPFAVHDQNMKWADIEKNMKDTNVFLDTELPALVHMKGHVTVKIIETHLFTALTNNGVVDVDKDKKRNTAFTKQIKEVADWALKPKSEITVSIESLEAGKDEIVKTYGKYLLNWKKECDADANCKKYWDLFVKYAPKSSEVVGAKVLTTLHEVEIWIKKIGLLPKRETSHISGSNPGKWEYGVP